ncbi:MAG: HAMP domain-containing sensor histidine kinase [Nitriliruptorales bacterium]|nr:HAMP domain-containing sensor histidine kinase [Nitriliruptorales bacterium]
MAVVTGDHQNAGDRGVQCLADRGATLSGANPLPEDIERARADVDLLRRRIVNVVGHALRTPMATLRGRAEVLVVEEDQDRRDEYARELLRAARRVEKLLDDVLVAAEIDTRLPVGKPEPLSVGPVAAQLAPEDAEVDDDGTQALVAKDALRWVLNHLIDNAEQYGDGPVEVTVRGADGQVRIVVGAPGPELPEEDIRLAFEPFYRGEHAVIRKAVGLGVGLPVARRIAEHAGGSLDLRHREGGGAEAVLTLDRA